MNFVSNAFIYSKPEASLVVCWENYAGLDSSVLD